MTAKETPSTFNRSSDSSCARTGRLHITMQAPILVQQLEHANHVDRYGGLHDMMRNGRKAVITTTIYG